jgi:hypothetical protein
MSDNLPQVEAALQAYMRGFDMRMGNAALEIAAQIEGMAQRNIKDERGVVARKVSFVDGKTKRGGKIYDYANDPAIIGNPPKNRTGNLRRSIRGQHMRLGYATYQAVIGADMIYARAVEMGAPYNPPSWQNGEHFPYLRPALEQFATTNIAIRILRKHLGVK